MKILQSKLHLKNVTEKIREKVDYRKIFKIDSLRKKNETTVILKTERFDNIDSAVIISSVNKPVKN